MVRNLTKFFSSPLSNLVLSYVLQTFFVDLMEYALIFPSFIILYFKEQFSVCALKNQYELKSSFFLNLTIYKYSYVIEVIFVNCISLFDQLLIIMLNQEQISYWSYFSRCMCKLYILQFLQLLNIMYLINILVGKIMKNLCYYLVHFHECWYL